MLIEFLAGFGYAFEDLKLHDWYQPGGLDDFSGNVNDVLLRPLVNQPGTKFQYGVGLDWVGTLIERVSGISLEQYFQTFILQPLDIRNISFFPTVEMTRFLAYMHQRSKDGSLSITDHIYRFPLLPCKSNKQRFCMGGGGCFGTPLEYCRMSN